MRARRFLLVPDIACGQATITSCTTSTGDPGQDGLSVRQPVPETGNACRGDLRPILTGTPEDDVAGRIAVITPGSSGAARWGFTRGSGSNLQLRQQANVLTHPDLLDRQPGVPLGGFTEYTVRPRLLSLKSGYLLAMWIRQARKPEDQASGQGQQVVWRSAMDAAGAWSAPVAPPGMSWGVGNTIDLELFDLAFVQYLDTGELLAVTVSSEHSFLNSTFSWDRRLTVLVSTDDGQSWVVRAQHVVKGSPADIDLGADDSSIISCTAQILNSGRLMVVVSTQLGAYSLVSDDRGATFTKAKQLMNYALALKGTGEANHPAVDYTGLTSTMLENGLCWTVLAVPPYRANQEFQACIYGWLTADGITFGARQDIGDRGPYAYVLHPAVVVRDDGWPMLYAEAHEFLVPEIGPVFNDVMVCRTAAKRTPGMSDDVDDIFPSVAHIADNVAGDKPTFWALMPFHGHSAGGGTGSLGNTAIIRNKGPAGGISAVRHRGSVWVAHAWMIETGSGSTVTLQESGITVARAHNWQPMQELLGPGWKLGVCQFGASPNTETTWGRAYHLCHDMQGYPGVWGWQVHQEGSNDGGTVAIGSATPRSYEEIEGGRYYFRTTLPNKNGEDSDLTSTGTASAGEEARNTGLFRLWVDVREGGSTSACDIGAQLNLTAGGTAYGVEVRLERTSDATVSIAFTNLGGSTYGSKSITCAVGEWIEVLAGVDGDGMFRAICMVRVWHPDTDPDFLSAYTQVADVAASQNAANDDSDEFFRWGHIATTTNARTSRWKLAHLHRPDMQIVDGTGYPAKMLQGRTHEWDGENTTVQLAPWLINAREPSWYLDRNDSGFLNLMRCPAAVSRPQFLERGLSAAWRGDAATRGGYTYLTGYDHGPANVLPTGTGKPWRVPTVDTSGYVPDTMLVLDAGAQGWTLDALAVFGRNWPNLRIELNGSNSWSAPARRIYMGLPLYPGDDAGLEEWHRSLADWLCDPIASGLSLLFSGRTAVVVNATTLASQAGIWRPHQWYSHPLGQGPQHYLAIRAEAAVLGEGAAPLNQTRVFRILDNDDSRLFLDDTPLSYWPTWNSNGVGNEERAAIFSDRFAVSIGQHMAASTVPYRYLRLTLLAHWRGRGETSAVTRRIIPGRLADLSASDLEWGWGWKVDPGVVVRQLPGGGTTTSEERPSLRTFSCEYNQRRFQAPTTTLAAPPRATTGTWQEIVDLLARTRHGAELCALVWQGERAVANGDTDKRHNPPDVAQDFELMLVRSGGHDIRQAAWQCAQQSLPSAGGDPTVASVVRPWMAVRSITFDEEA